MAKIVGAIFTSHVPAIGGAIARGAQQDSYWKPFFDGYAPVRAWLERANPDLVVVIYNDHGLNFFLDKLPTFAVGAAPEYRNDDEGGACRRWGRSPATPSLSWHLIESLVADEFDVTTCQEMYVDHAFTVPLSLLWPDPAERRFRLCRSRSTPCSIRCPRLNAATSSARRSGARSSRTPRTCKRRGARHRRPFASAGRRRAGFINKGFDLFCLDKIASDPAALASLSIRDLVAAAGTQGVELVMWLAARGTLRGPVSKLHQHYHVPISNTAAGLVLLEQATEPSHHPQEVQHA